MVGTPLVSQVPKYRHSSRLNLTDIEPIGDAVAKSSTSPPPKRNCTTGLSPLSSRSVVDDTVHVPLVAPVNELVHSSSEASIETDESLVSPPPIVDGSLLLTPISASDSQDSDYEEEA